MEDTKEGYNFRLLRCSTNLTGPTDNFRTIDKFLVQTLNNEASRIFDNSHELNHVLAQIYHNTKTKKAKIKSHADKTKDMPPNGIMAFCTFYDNAEHIQDENCFTRLMFKIKENTEGLPDSFVIKLLPNSVFFMPLSTNRLYTHEIRPGYSNSEKLPTRMGYVVRCSKAEAIYTNGKTFLKTENGLQELEQPTEEGIEDLRKLYVKENKSTEHIDYGDRFMFSMNKGDYEAPSI